MRRWRAARFIYCSKPSGSLSNCWVYYSLRSANRYNCWSFIYRRRNNMAEYAHPEVLVSTEWVAAHVNDPAVRIAEVDVDTKAYDEGHVPGAIGWAWNTQLCDTLRRDILSKEQFEALMSSSG